MNETRLGRTSWVRLVLLAAFALPAAAVWADEPEFPKFEEVTKDTKVKEGFLTLYHHEKDDRLLARVPKGLLRQNFLVASSIARGPFFAGWQWNDAAVYFDRVGKKLVLMEADPRYKKGTGSPVDDVISRSYPDNIIRAVPIRTEIDGDPVIDLGDLFKQDLIGAGGIFGGSLDANLSRYGAVKNFPNNTEISVDAAMMQGPSGQIVGLHYSLSRLPQDNGYTPREADPRVGYFLTAVRDWSSPHEADTTFKRYIHRWHLRKAEPEAKVSDVLPQDQIVFYIEKTVPVKFRHYVREGILEWNNAFEAAGLRNAIKVIQQSDSDEQTKDLDPEDVRYNFFRWIVTGQAFAMGPSRANPFTGQILDADIIFDDSFVRSLQLQHDVLGPRATASFTDFAVEDLLAHHPEWDFTPAALIAPEPTPPTPLELYRAQHGACCGQHGHSSMCEIGLGGARELALAALTAAQAGAGGLTEEFIGQAIKETVTHEVGHTLGLRHNFKASSWLPLEEIKSVRSDRPSATSASVMDYNAYVFAATPEAQGLYVSPLLGPYDLWAIDYGYRTFTPEPGNEAAPKSEADMLKAIAARSAEPGLDYATDEDTSNLYPDPTVNRWDMGKNPVDFAKDRIGLAERLWKDGLEWAVEDGKSYQAARRAFSFLLGQYSFGAQTAGRLVGGQYLNRDHKGTPNARPPIVVVPAAEQREALRFVADTVLSAKSFQFPPELLNRLAAGRWLHWDSDAADSELDFDLHRRVLAIQMGALFQVLNPVTVNRVYDAELKVPATEDAFGVPELFGTLTQAIWSELETGAQAPAGTAYTNRAPLIPSFRRNLQREYLQRLIELVVSPRGTGVHPDVHALGRLTIKELEQRIGQTLDKTGPQLDAYSRAHLVDSRQRINKALEAKYTISG
ncbi:MAG TPA: zinc-dependent metalloprotease [Phycisphaerae bacterium]|nr:zinc-dependent metalloprotease [Phycisphaerae bacterium]HNU44986.1 zinc-dependent metalloprotease [Phycisphaerae bacterium]